MKKTYNLLLVILTVMVATLTCGCYHIESSESEDYKGFLSEMETKNKSIHSFLPKLEETDCIEDMYFCYSDGDVFDSTYTVYLKCTYEADAYAKEVQRLNSEYPLCGNSDSFDYNAIVIEETFELYEANSVEMDSGAVYVRYTYALYDDSTSQIIYVTTYVKGEITTFTDHVPSEYLPKAIVEWQSK